MSAPPRDPASPAYELLRDLLPRFYWAREAGDGALAALVAALADEYERLRGNVEGLYDEFFIQTCSPAIVPYIGYGVGVAGLGPVHGPGVGDRAWVGRIVGLRRRKGTLATAARAVAAATEWAIFLQDGRDATAHTQSVLYPHPDRGQLVDVSQAAAARESDAPWSVVTRNASVAGRPVCAGIPAGGSTVARAGYPGPQTVEVAVWRLQSFPVTCRTPRRLERPSDLEGRAFTLHPAGTDIRLFATPAHAADRGLPDALGDLPLPLTVASLGAALAAARSPQDAPVAVWRRDAAGRVTPVPRGLLVAGDLSDWRVRHHRHAEAIVDPHLGRLLFCGHRPEEVQVSYAYGFAGPLGGGPYGHASSYAALGPHTEVLHVGRTTPGAPPGIYHSIRNAIATAARQPAGSDCLLLVTDSATYGHPGERWRIVLDGGRTLRIASTPEAAPVLDGCLDVSVAAGSRLELSGLTVLGTVTVEGQGELAVEHSTLAPRDTASIFVPDGSAPAVSLSYVVLGPIDAGGEALVSTTATIVDGHGGDAIGSSARPAGALDLRQVTVLGSSTARTVVAEDCIFAKRVIALAPGDGLIRSSFVPGESTAGVLVGCQPVPGADVPVHPMFTSTRWGDAGYAQLDLRCSPAIAHGAAQGGEMGAFNWLRQPTRFARLPLVLNEMLPAAIAASVDYRN